MRATVVWVPPPSGDYRVEGAPELVEAEVVELVEMEDPPDDRYGTPF